MEPPVLTTHGNPLVATAPPIAVAPAAITVAMTHFVVAKGGQPVATSGVKFHVVYKILQKSGREPVLLLLTLQHLPLRYQLL